MIVKPVDNNPLTTTNLESTATILSLGTVIGLTYLAYQNKDTLQARLMKLELKRHVVKAAADQFYKENKDVMQEMNKEDLMAHYNDAIESNVHLNPTDDIVSSEKREIEALESKLRELSDKKDPITSVKYSAYKSHAMTSWDITQDGKIPDDIMVPFNKENKIKYNQQHADLIDKSREYRSKYIDSLRKRIRKASNSTILRVKVGDTVLSGRQLSEHLDNETKELVKDLLDRSPKMMKPDNSNTLVRLSNGLDNIKINVEPNTFGPYTNSVKEVIDALGNLKEDSDGKITSVQVDHTIHGDERRLSVSLDIKSTSGHISSCSFEIPIQDANGLIPNHLQYGGTKRVSRRFVTFNPLVNDITKPIDVKIDSTHMIMKSIVRLLRSQAKNILIESNNSELFQNRVRQTIGNITARLATKSTEVRQSFIASSIQSLEDAEMQVISQRSRVKRNEDLKVGLNTIRQLSSLKRGNVSVITLDLETLNTHVDSPQLAATSDFTKIWQYGIVVSDSTGVSKDIRQVSSNYVLDEDVKLSKIKKMLDRGAPKNDILKIIESDVELNSYIQYTKKVTGEKDDVEAIRQYIRDIEIRGQRSDIKNSFQMAESLKNTLAQMIQAEKAKGKKVLLGSFNGYRFDLKVLAVKLNTTVKALAKDLGLTSSDLIDTHQAKKVLAFGDFFTGANSLEDVTRQWVLESRDYGLKNAKFEQAVLDHMSDDMKNLLRQIMPDKVLIPGKLAHNNAAWDAALAVKVMHALGDYYGKFDSAKQEAFIRYIESHTSGKSEDMINRFLQIQGATFNVDGKMVKASLSGLSSNQTSKMIFGMTNIGAMDPFMILDPLNKDLHQFNRNIWVRKDKLATNLISSPLQARGYLQVRDMYLPKAGGYGNALTNKLQMDTIFTFNRVGSHSGTAVFTKDAFELKGYSLRNVAMTDIINDADQHNNIKQLYNNILKRAKEIGKSNGVGLNGEAWEQASQEVIAKSNAITRLNKTGVRLRTDDRTIQHRGNVEIVGVHFRQNNGGVPTAADISVQIMLHENAFTGQIAWNAAGRKIVADRSYYKSAEIATGKFGITPGVMAQEQLEFLSSKYHGSMKQMMVEKAITILQRRIQNGDKEATQKLKKLAQHFNAASPELNFEINPNGNGLIFGSSDLYVSATEVIESVSKIDSKIIMEALAIAGHEAVFTYDTLAMYYQLHGGKVGSFRENYKNGKSVLNGYISSIEKEIDKTVMADVDLKKISGAGGDQKYLLKYLDPMNFIEEHYNAKFKASHGGKSFSEVFFADRNIAEKIISSANIPIFLQALPDINDPKNELGQIGLWAPGLTRTLYNMFTGKNVKNATVKLSRTWLDQVQASPHLNFSWAKSIFHHNLGMNRTRRARDVYHRVDSFKRLFNDSNISSSMLHVGVNDFQNTFKHLIDNPESTKLLREQIGAALRNDTLDKIPAFNMNSLQLTDLLLSKGVTRQELMLYKSGEANTNVLGKIDMLIKQKLKTKVHASDIISHLNKIGNNDVLAIELKGGVNVNFESLISRYGESELRGLNIDRTKKLFSENKSGIITLSDSRLKMTSAALLPFRTMASYMGNVDSDFGTYQQGIKEERQLLMAIKKLNSFEGNATERASHEQDVALQWLKYINRTMNFAKGGAENTALHKTAIPGTQLMYRSNEATIVRIDQTLKELTSGDIVSETKKLLDDKNFKNSMTSLFSADAYKDLYVGGEIDTRAALTKYLQNIKGSIHGHTAIMNSASFSADSKTQMVSSFNNKVEADITLQRLFTENGIKYNNGVFGISVNAATIEDKKVRAMSMEMQRIARGEATLPGAIFLRHPTIQNGINPGTVGDIALVQSQVANFLGISKDNVYMAEVMGDLQKSDSDTDLNQIILRGFRSIDDINEIRKDTAISNKLLLEKNVFFQESLKLYNASNYVRRTYVKNGVGVAAVSQLVVDSETGLSKFIEKEVEYTNAFYGFTINKSGDIEYVKTGKTQGLSSMAEIDNILQSAMRSGHDALIDRHIANESAGALGKNLIGIFTNTVRQRIHDLFYMNPGLHQNADLMLKFIGDLDHGLTAYAQAPVSNVKHGGIGDIVQLSELLQGLKSPGAVDSKKYEDLKEFWKKHNPGEEGEKTFKMLFTRMAGFDHIKRLDPEFAERNQLNFAEAVGQDMSSIDVAYNDRSNKLAELDGAVNKLGSSVGKYMQMLNEASNNYSPAGLNDLVLFGNETYEDVLTKQLKNKFGGLLDHPIVQGLRKSKKGAAVIGLAYLGANFFRPMQMSNSFNPADGFIDVGSVVDTNTKLFGSDLELDRSVSLDTVNASFSKEAYIDMQSEYKSSKFKKAKAHSIKDVIKAANSDMNMGTSGFSGNPNITYTSLRSNNSMFGSGDLSRRLRMINHES